MQSLIITVGHIALRWASRNDYREKLCKVPGFFHLHFFQPASKNFSASNWGEIVCSLARTDVFGFATNTTFKRWYVRLEEYEFTS